MNLASAGINALCNEDKTFIVKRSDAILDLGASQACPGFSEMTFRDNGVTYFLIGWVMSTVLSIRGPPPY